MGLRGGFRARIKARQNLVTSVLAQEVLGALLGGLGEPLLSTFVKLIGKDEEKLERLEELIRQKRREKK
jgi:hypothetical protein